jgi:hypothetical protein
MDCSREIYQYSGRLGASALFLPSGALLLAVALSAGYAWAQVYGPRSGYSSVMLLVIYAACAGFGIGHLSVITKCRNLKFVFAVGLLGSLVAIYAQWVFYVHAWLSRGEQPPPIADLLHLFLAPGDLWRHMEKINTVGRADLFGDTPTGALLWGFWIAEAISIIIGMALIPVGIAFNRVFCERCARWCRRIENQARFHLAPEREVVERLRTGEIGALSELSVAPSDATPALRLDLHACESCNDTAVYQLHVVETQLRRGKPKQVAEELTAQFVLKPGERIEIERLASKPVQEMPSA